MSTIYGFEVGTEVVAGSERLELVVVSARGVPESGNAERQECHESWREGINNIDKGIGVLFTGSIYASTHKDIGEQT